MHGHRALLLGGSALLATTAMLAPGPLLAPTSAAPTPTLTASMRDLGTLGGDSSEPLAIDGNIVVGLSQTADGEWHAFSYDLGAANPTMRALPVPAGGGISPAALSGKVTAGWGGVSPDTKQHAVAIDLGAPNPHLIDLGTFGGDWSSALAVSGKVVVGSADMPADSPDRYHAFAYDLGAANPRLKDLGTLGGPYSEATAIDGNIVVGWSFQGQEEDSRPFAYDLGAANPRMIDLGTLGGDHGEAHAISGKLVVGDEQIGETGSRAFAYDLGAASPKMRDLGNLGGTWATATAVDGTLAVGSSSTGAGERSRAFIDDLGSATPRMRSIGTLGGAYGGATNVDGSIVVGTAARAGDGAERVFAYDAAAAAPKLTDLGPASYGITESQDPVDVSGKVVIGSVPAGGDKIHAVVWTLRETTAPVMEFSGLHTWVDENAGKATVTVVRRGDTAPAVTVHYAGTGVRARAGQDFKPVSGTLSFASGQTAKTFTVPIVDDNVPEQAEGFMVSLSKPTGGAILGTPRTAGLGVRASDQRPDVLISTRQASRYAGNNVYNLTGHRQTKVAPTRRGHWRTFYARVQNDGNVTNTFVLRGRPSPPGSTVRYASSSGATDLTAAMTSSAGWRVTVPPRKSKMFRMQLRPVSTAAIGARKVVWLRATWTGDGTRNDLVRAVARVQR